MKIETEKIISQMASSVHTLTKMVTVYDKSCHMFSMKPVYGFTEAGI